MWKQEWAAQLYPSVSFLPHTAPYLPPLEYHGCLGRGPTAADLSPGASVERLREAPSAPLELRGYGVSVANQLLNLLPVDLESRRKRLPLVTSEVRLREDKV